MTTDDDNDYETAYEVAMEQPYPCVLCAVVITTLLVSIGWLGVIWGSLKVPCPGVTLW